MNPSAPLSEVRAFLDDFLNIRHIADYPNALNGLQLENTGEVCRIGAAVDASGFTISQSVERGIDLLLVHHGMFWSGLQPLTGGNYRQWKLAMDAGLAIYAAHLPLDVHPEVGNNALLCQALGLGRTTPFFEAKGTHIGLRATMPCERADLVALLETAVGGPVRVCPGGPRKVREIGVVTGGAGGEVRKAAAEGIDTFVTGEGPHWTYAMAEELGINVLYGGHYATETFGVRALAKRVGERFSLPWDFIDHPTGL